MNEDIAQGKLEQLKGELRKTWGKLTDDDVALYKGNRDKFVGKVREYYGLSQDEAEKQLDTMERACGCPSSKAA